MPWGEGCPPLIDAVRCEEPAIAAADGSNVEVSLKDLPSGMDCWTWVGELVLGVEPPGNSFFERVLVRLPDFSGWATTGGDVRA